MTSSTTDLTESMSKIDSVIALMQQESGGTLDDIVARTGWLPHSARSVLTGLRKKGRVITRTKVEGVSRYSIEPEQAG